MTLSDASANDRLIIASCRKSNIHQKLRSIPELLTANNVQVLPWPANSAYLSHIGNV